MFLKKHSDSLDITNPIPILQLMKAIKLSKTKRGDKLALTKGPNGFGVWIQKTNYSLGREVKSWCYLLQHSTEEEAEKVFKRRSA